MGCGCALAHPRIHTGFAPRHKWSFWESNPGTCCIRQVSTFVRRRWMRLWEKPPRVALFPCQSWAWPYRNILHTREEQKRGLGCLDAWCCGGKRQQKMGCCWRSSQAECGQGPGPRESSSCLLTFECGSEMSIANPLVHNDVHPNPTLRPLFRQAAGETGETCSDSAIFR